MIELFIAFGAGLISFLSPCVLPLIPGYISYITSGKYETYFNSTKATAILVNNTFKNNQIKKTIILYQVKFKKLSIL